MDSMKRLEIFRLLVDVKEMLCSAMAGRMKNNSLTETELMILYILQHKEGQWKMGDLANALFIPMSTLTGIVDKMIEKGILQRERSDTDRRVVFIRIHPLFVKNSAIYMEKLSGLLDEIAKDMGEENFDRLGADLSCLEEVLNRKQV